MLFWALAWQRTRQSAAATEPVGRPGGMAAWRRQLRPLHARAAAAAAAAARALASIVHSFSHSPRRSACATVC